MTASLVPRHLGIAEQARQAHLACNAESLIPDDQYQILMEGLSEFLLHFWLCQFSLLVPNGLTPEWFIQWFKLHGATLLSCARLKMPCLDLR